MSIYSNNHEFSAKVRAVSRSILKGGQGQVNILP